ncbi:UDP-N-acetylglucosamine--N-acetylmuramyl-(pentapeptide) pyrophosphoryl-undecaprenol N-acetylglucosamine transferase [Candidatus Gracilibacteria bacterium]|nr:UDP-N-acetylglucosamine--N-acetylmuramyl-(pentapeptide) pyrophosphoryl-undecaprenol N-acetylglucosamine transferase [Candidatus Gracilibacteria bacterium]
MKKQTITLTGGGSGGHIFPLLSLYNFLQEEDKYNFLWVGEAGELEEEIAEQNSIEFHDIAAGKIRRYFDWRNFYEPLKNLTGLFEGLYYIWKYKIDIVFSKGGFVSLPLTVAAFLMRKKIYVHESDIKTGLANKLVSKCATKVFHTFPKENLSSKNITTGQIVNPQLLEGLKSMKVGTNKRLKVLVIAGSQGSTIIFKNLIKILPDLSHIDFEIILGEKNLDFRKELDVFTNTTVYDFVDQKTLGIIYKNTDIAITRGSATVLWELYYFGIHSIIIPITNAGGHQIHNAEYFNKNYESDILDENVNLSLEMFRKLKAYSELRKKRLNLDGFFDAMKIIEKEL